MLEHDSPRVQRSVTPSALRATPARSRKQLRDLYSSSPPGFLSDALYALEEVPDASVPSELPKHFLRDFPFRVVDGRIDPTYAQLSDIAAYFPGCTGVAYGPPYLVVSWAKEQVKPWPLTVGGLPLYYATPDHSHPPTYAKGGRSSPMMTGAEERLKPWQSPSNDLIEKIANILVEKGIGLKLFGWCGVRWYAEVVCDMDGMQLPTTICGLLLMWEVFSNFGESARRTIIPSEKIVDNTSYKPVLRPGVLLESREGAGTTSGIPLKGPDGKRWFTVAQHGFKLDGEVHHPGYVSGDSLIGHVHDISFPGSDIGLVKLEDGMTYSNISFDGKEVEGINLEVLVNPENLSIGQSLFLDSPYNGRCEGILGWRGVNVVDPVDSKHPNFYYLHVSMIYFGNGTMDDVIPGSCGSAIWNEDNEVAAFFRWYDPITAIAYASGVNVLIQAGYILEAIPLG